MTRKLITGPRILIVAISMVLAAALYVAMSRPAIEVESAEVTRGPLRVTVNDLAETRVHDLYTVSAPVGGELLRLPLKPGDPVVAGKTVLAEIQPVEPAPLDARSLAQAQSSVSALAAQVAAARSRVEEATAAADLAERQLARVAALRSRGFAAQAALDEARAARDRARASAVAARESETAARHSREAARAALIVPGGNAAGRGIARVRAPVSGFVMTVPQESMRVVAAGTPLVTIGDPKNLEMVTDLLSQDAVQVRPGAEVSVEDWGGDRPLRGRVRLIEPYGFLKVSALGVEEQRVNVVIDFAEPYRAWQRLGHGFRATVRISIWYAPDVVRVPLGALFRSGNSWRIFRMSAEGRAHGVMVRLGRMNEDYAQVLDGLAPGDRVILHPGDKIAEGVSVRIGQRQ